MKLYEYAIIFEPHSTKEHRDAGQKPKATLLVDVTRILVNNEQEAQMVAARAIPEEYMDRLEQITIACRPF